MVASGFCVPSTLVPRQLSRSGSGRESRSVPSQGTAAGSGLRVGAGTNPADRTRLRDVPIAGETARSPLLAQVRRGLRPGLVLVVAIVRCDLHRTRPVMPPAFPGAPRTTCGAPVPPGVGRRERRRSSLRRCWVTRTAGWWRVFVRRLPLEDLLRRLGEAIGGNRIAGASTQVESVGLADRWTPSAPPEPRWVQRMRRRL